MSIIDMFGKQPKSRMLIEAVLWLGLVAWVDLVTPWHFSMFVFYLVPTFLIALHFPRPVGIGFAFFVALVGLAANYDSIPYRGVGGYLWSGVNRTIGMQLAALCATSIRNFREETRRRLEALEHAQELEREIVRTSEREQMRIGQDLHDGVCQSLAALDCAAQCLKMDLEKEGAPQAGLAAEIQKQLCAATIEARNLAKGVYPVTVEQDGLSVALQGLVMATKSLTQAAITFESDENVIFKDPEAAMHLYRITQEALSNAMRHANAGHIKVRLAREPRALSISVADDGGGSAIQSRGDGMGWRTMTYRANLIGAKIEVEKPPAGGTTVRCSLPVPARPS